jgi:hypothetical protein
MYISVDPEAIKRVLGRRRLHPLGTLPGRHGQRTGAATVMAKLSVTMRFRDLDRYRMFVWELNQLADRMRVEASPYAEPLEHAIGRFIDGGDDEHGDDGPATRGYSEDRG